MGSALGPAEMRFVCPKFVWRWVLLLGPQAADMGSGGGGLAQQRPGHLASPPCPQHELSFLPFAGNEINLVFIVPRPPHLSSCLL